VFVFGLFAVLLWAPLIPLAAVVFIVVFIVLFKVVLIVFVLQFTPPLLLLVLAVAPTVTGALPLFRGGGLLDFCVDESLGLVETTETLFEICAVSLGVTVGFRGVSNRSLARVSAWILTSPVRIRCMRSMGSILPVRLLLGCTFFNEISE